MQTRYVTLATIMQKDVLHHNFWIKALKDHDFGGKIYVFEVKESNGALYFVLWP